MQPNTPLLYVLKRAKALIEKHGWIQNDYGDRERGFCSDGAIMAAYDEVYDAAVYPAPITFYQVSKHLSDTCRVLDPERPDNVVGYNDRGDQTKEKILEMYDLAIERAGNI